MLKKLQDHKKQLILAAIGMVGSAALGGTLFYFQYLRRKLQIQSSLTSLNSLKGVYNEINTFRFQNFVRLVQYQRQSKFVKSRPNNYTALQYRSKSGFQQLSIIRPCLAQAQRFQSSFTFQIIILALADVSQVLLDIKCLNIKRVCYAGNDLEFTVQRHEKISKTLGDQLVIKLPKGMYNYIHSYKALENRTNLSIFELQIFYETLPGNQEEPTGLNWLYPSQTYGGNHPYLFTQCEPIYGRTLVNILFQILLKKFPCQDSPQVKSTFSATIELSKPYSAYVSGILQKKNELEKTNQFEFRQDIPIPSYLFSIVAGNLDYRRINQRTGVISEPEFVDKCAKEFEHMELYLSTIEKYISPYEWKEFNVVVLPKSFPFGGMENPNLTFASPSIVVGDKSATDVIIHEMVHSWSGNLISCANWECFWLNEGFTMFFEREAIRVLEGEDLYKLSAVIGDRSLKQSVQAFGPDHIYTSLSPNLEHENPDDAFSSVPYEKGFQYLRFLQERIGSDRFKIFMRQTVKKYSYQSFNNEQFRQDLINFINENNLKIDIQWDAWVKQVHLFDYLIQYKQFISLDCRLCPQNSKQRSQKNIINM